MKTICTAVLSAMIVAGLMAANLQARLPYKKGFEGQYADNAKLMAAAKEAKCNICHYGKTKKNRNDYGMALSKHLSKDLYEELKKEPEKLNEKVVEALKMVETMKKNDEGTFGDLIKAGTLPGTEPEEAGGE